MLKDGIGVWVHKDDISKYIDIRNLYDHLQNDWTEGRGVSRFIIYEKII